MGILRDEKGVLRAQGDLHISEIEETRSTLIRELNEAPRLVLDLSEVNSCDAASFQLLCSLQKSAERDGKQLRILSPSAAMHEASATLGLSLEDLTCVPKDSQA
jgi:anti-anti-sigma factor